MIRLLLVHGTGTREPDYSKAVQHVSDAVAGLPNIVVQPCYWGGTVGCRLNLNGDSIPTYPVTKAVAEVGAPPPVSDADRVEVLWDLLDRDPAFELHLLSQGVNRDAQIGAAPTPAPLRRLDAGLASSAPGRRLADQLRSLGITRDFDAAAGMVRALPEAKTVAGLSGGGIVALARAIIAYMAYLHPLSSAARSVVADMVVRDGLVQALAEHLAGAEKGPKEIAAKVLNAAGTVLTGLAGLATLKTGTWLGQRRRGRLMDAATPGAGDILLYQARGAKFRDFIRDEIGRSKDEVVLLAHSLGGVACVDTLIETPGLPVRQLITVGSQAPYFYEIGALQKLEVDPATPLEQRLPKTFPPWLNCYDLRDFLSYVGRPVFGDIVEDVQVDNGRMFPLSHTSYWANEAVWVATCDRLRQL